MSPRNIAHFDIKLPNGTICELNAAEICRLYRKRAVHFSTLLRPVGTEEFHRFDEEPAFMPFLGALHRAQRLFLSRWIILIDIYPWLLFLIIPLILPPEALAFLIVFPPFFIGIMAMYLGTLQNSVISCWHRPIARQSLWQLCLPYWNGVAGFRLFRKIVLGLPEKQRKVALFLSGVTCTLWAVVPLTGVLAPVYNSGAMIFYIILLLTTVSVLLTYFTFSLNLKQIRADWLAENPTPRQPKKQQTPFFSFQRQSPTPPVWDAPTRTDWLKWVLGGLGIGITSLALFIAPYWLVGNIQCQRARQSFSHYEIVNQAPAALTPAIPDIPAEYLKFLRESKTTQPLPTALEQQIQTLSPDLDYFRENLKQLQLPEGKLLNLYDAVSNGASPDSYVQSERNYISWRQLEQRIYAQAVPIAMTEALFNDLENLAKLQVLGDTWQLLLCATWNRMRFTLLEDSLDQLSSERLADEQMYWQQDALNISEHLDKALLIALRRARQLWLGNPGSRSIAQLWFRPFWPSWEAMCLDMIKVVKNAEDADFEPTRRHIGRLMFQIIMGFPRQEYEFAVRQKAYGRLALTAIEWELYRREHGNAPENPVLPADPFGGEPLHYLPGKAIYSIDKDLVDDGGCKKGSPNDTKDLVFRLKATSN